MNYFFLDFENVHTDGIGNMGLVQRGDMVVIMYSEQCKNITLDTMNDLIGKSVTLRCFKVSVGSKDALDFQLSTYLGFIIGQHPEQKSGYYIVSKDTGYDRVCEFWRTQGFMVTRIKAMAREQEGRQHQPEKQQEKASEQKPKVPESNKATLEEIEKYLLPEDSPEDILAIVNRYKTKQSIMRAISKEFKDSKKAGAVYKKLKPLLKEKNKT